MSLRKWWYNTLIFFYYCAARDSFIAHRFGMPVRENLNGFLYDLSHPPRKGP